jgi:hypothetical protein
LGRSRGGLSTKIHLLADEVGLPVAFRITPGQAAEYAEAICLPEGQRAEAVIADKGYDSAKIVATIEGIGGRCHPAPAPLETAAQLRSHLVQTAQSHRTLLQPAQAIPPLQHTILPKHRSLPILHRPRMRLDQTSAICGYRLGRFTGPAAVIALLPDPAIRKWLR